MTSWNIVDLGANCGCAVRGTLRLANRDIVSSAHLD